MGWFLLYRRTATLGFDTLGTILPWPPRRSMLPEPGDMRYNWLVVRVAEIDLNEMTELVVDAWRMVVPRTVVAAYERRQE